MAPLTITVAICTWNRAAMLAQTLSRLERLTIPAELSWDVVVVDNHSTDGTAAVIASFEGRLPIRPVWEPTAGVAHARNTAIGAATGDYVLWIDDDILVDADWMAGYLRAFSRWPDAAVFGGPIEPCFEGTAPAWLDGTLDLIGPVFGRQTFGPEPVALAAATTGAGPYGGNMAFKRQVLSRFPFDPGLGPRHADYSPGEETDVIRRILAAGHQGWWTPDARVRHWVPVAHQTLAHVRRWMTGSGRADARARARRGLAAAAADVWDVVRVVGHEAAFRLLRPIAPPRVWMTNLACASLARGRLARPRSAAPARSNTR